MSVQASQASHAFDSRVTPVTPVKSQEMSVLSELFAVCAEQAEQKDLPSVPSSAPGNPVNVMIYEPVNPCILVSFSILRSEVPCVCNVILCQIQSQKGNRLDHRSPLLSYVSPVSTYREYLVKINV